MAVGGLDDVLQGRLLLRQSLEVGVRLGIGGVDGIQLGQGGLDLRHGLFDVFPHVLRGIQPRLLVQVSDAYAGLGACLAQMILVLACHDTQQAGFARAIQSQHANLSARKEGE